VCVCKCVNVCVRAECVCVCVRVCVCVCAWEWGCAWGSAYACVNSVCGGVWVWVWVFVRLWVRVWGGGVMVLSRRTPKYFVIVCVCVYRHTWRHLNTRRHSNKQFAAYYTCSRSKPYILCHKPQILNPKF